MEKIVRVPKQKRSIKTRTRIMDAGLELFSTKGYHRTNSNEIARTAGVAVGSFYAYFKDKKALFLEIMQSHWEEQFSNVELPPENLDDPKVETWDMLYNLLKSLVKIHDIAPEFHQEQYAVAHTDNDINEKILEWNQIGLEISINYLKMWKDHIRITDLTAAAMIWNKTMEENIHLIRFSKTEIEEERLIQELTDMLHEYLFGTA
jgi:AcrR family transcriptional regulator